MPAHCSSPNAPLQLTEMKDFNKTVTWDVTDNVTIRLLPFSRSFRCYSYAKGDLDTIDISSDVYYMPREKNNAAYDSFAIMDGEFFAFQATIAATHPLKPSGFDLLARLFKPKPGGPLRNVAIKNFVIVIPPGQDVSCTVPSTCGITSSGPSKSPILSWLLVSNHSSALSSVGSYQASA